MICWRVCVDLSCAQLYACVRVCVFVGLHTLAAKSAKRPAACLLPTPALHSRCLPSSLFLSFSRCCRCSSASPSLLLRPPLTRLATCFARLCLCFCLCFCLCLCLGLCRCLCRCLRLCFLFFLPYTEAHKNSLVELLTSLLTNVPAHKWRRQCVHIKLCLYTHITYVCTHMSPYVHTWSACDVLPTKLASFKFYSLRISPGETKDSSRKLLEYKL